MVVGRKGRLHAMILTTTPSIENRSIASYLGIVTGEAIVGANIDYEVLGSNNGMLMVSISGTAVKLG
jgi:uncharacterized protein YbjQ (UPF0145 family)